MSIIDALMYRDAIESHDRKLAAILRKAFGISHSECIKRSKASIKSYFNA